MKKLAGFLFAFSSALAACTTAPPSTSQGEQKLDCVAISDWGCSTSADCCSGGVCQPNGTCMLPDGAACNGMEGCAGHYCVDGACASSCAPNGHTVNDSAECCSGIVGPDGVTCDNVSSCVAVNDWGCADTSDCCGDGVCQPNGVCKLPDGAACNGMEGCASHYCVDGACASSCAPNGHTVNDSAECCSGIVGPDGVTCDNVAQCVGISDWGCADNGDCCAGGVCQPNGYCMLPDGAVCNGMESCAGHYCVDGVCASSCAVNGQSVNDSAECCSGIIGPFGTCDNIEACVAIADYGCADDGDCCTDGGGICVGGSCRIPDGGACRSMEGCIGGHHCVDGACSASCGLAGQKVEDAADCCSGMVGSDGVTCTKLSPRRR